MQAKRTTPKITSKRLEDEGPQKFTQQEVDLRQTPLFFPDGFEKVFLVAYFIVLPYIVGLFFLFFYIAQGKLELFTSLSERYTFLLTWTIGYEIIAGILMLLIFKMALSFVAENRNKNSSNAPFRRPK